MGHEIAKSRTTPPGDKAIWARTRSHLAEATTKRNPPDQSKVISVEDFAESKTLSIAKFL